jgi:ABC-type multidrug transport system ATPase subunit
VLFSFSFFFLFPARAIAKDADIYLLDDPTASLDSHVSKYVIENAFLGTLRSNSKTVIWATHQLHLLPKTDYVIVMKEGKVDSFGTFYDLMKDDNSSGLKEMMKGYHYDDDDDREKTKAKDEKKGGGDPEAEMTLKAVMNFEAQKAVAEDRRSVCIKIILCRRKLCWALHF